MARGRRRELPLNAEINVVSLIDVMLLLLVIFMITAPLVAPGEIQLPTVGSKLTVPQQPLEVTLRKGELYLRADQGVPYGRVVQVLGAMKAADVATVGLIAEPEAAGPAPAP